MLFGRLFVLPFHIHQTEMYSKIRLIWFLTCRDTILSIYTYLLAIDVLSILVSMIANMIYHTFYIYIFYLSIEILLYYRISILVFYTHYYIHSPLYLLFYCIVLDMI